MARAGSKINSLKQPKEEINVKYMHKPPTITPNYGNQKRTILPKSKVSRVLLYDNATQEHMLDIKLAHIRIEKERISRLINLHKRSFSTRQTKRQQRMQASLSSGSKAITSHNSASRIPPPDKKENKMPIISQSSQRDEISKRDIVELAGQNKPKEEDDILEELKLPSIDNERRVIFKLEDSEGNTQVYHTIDEDRLIEKMIPLHTYYSKLTDDPRFKSLQASLVPLS